MLDEVLRSDLDRSPYYPTDIEVEAAANWLRKTRGAASYRDLKEICGESRMAIYRYMDYLRVPSTPSPWRARALKSQDQKKEN